MRAWAIALIIAFGSGAAAADGPGLIITYHCQPASRPVLRNGLAKETAKTLERLKREGSVTAYRLLAARYADSEGFDAMAEIAFADDAALARWAEIERQMPAGLPAAALAVATAIETVPVERVRIERRSDEAADRSVFLVVPYEYLVARDAYVTYVDGYVVPQFKGWMSEGVLASYEIDLARYPAGRKWSALIFLEYNDDLALGRRDAVTAKIRARLKEDPAWKAIADDKARIRVEKAPVVADRIAPE